MSRNKYIRIYYVLKEEDPNASFPLELDPGIIQKPRLILVYERNDEREKAVLYVSLLKNLQTNASIYLLVNRNEDAERLKSLCNQFVPEIAGIDRFGHPDSYQLANVKIIIASYQRFLNKFLEGRIKGIKTIIFYEYDKLGSFNCRVKELLLNQLIDFKGVINSSKNIQPSRQYHVVLIWRKPANSYELLLRQISVLESNQEYDRLKINNMEL